VGREVHPSFDAGFLGGNRKKGDPKEKEMRLRTQARSFTEEDRKTKGVG